jgi:hypothetical protein
LIERTAVSLRLAGEDREAIAAAVRPFLEKGSALGLCASVLCAAFDRAVRLAGFADTQRERRLRICATVGNEHFQGGWPYWTE